MFIVIFCAFLLAVSPGVVQGRCSNSAQSLVTKVGCITAGYTYYESTCSCYKLYREAKSWDAAVATCAANGGHLVVIDDQNEADAIKQLNLTEDITYTYVGIRDNSGYGDWKSVTGKPLNEIYNNWQNGRPAISLGYNFNCAVILPTGNLDNYGCGIKREFICEL